MQSKYKRWWLTSLLLIVIATGWYFSRPYPPQHKLSSAEEIHVKELLTGMKTWCVGRYLIDLPASFTLSSGTDPLEEEQWIADINWPERSYKTYLTNKRMYYPAFEQLLKRREKELTETRTYNPDNMPFLKKIWSLPAGMKGVIFERNQDTSANDALRTLEAYVYSNGVAMKFQKESIDYSSERYSRAHKDLGGVINYIPGDIDKLNDLISRIKGRGEDEIPREAGSCLANAFIATDKKGHEQEDVSFLFSSEKLAGVDFVVSTNNFLQAEESLLKRADEISRKISEVDGKVIRKGRREINNMKAEEMLITAYESDGENPGYIFNFYINETQGSDKTPWLNITLRNGGNADIPSTGYSQDELVEFWTAVTQTIRMRPGAN